MGYILIFFIGLALGAYLHHLLFSSQYKAVLDQMETARDKHNHYAERYRIEALRAYKDGVEIRTEPKEGIEKGTPKTIEP